MFFFNGLNQNANKENVYNVITSNFNHFKAVCTFYMQFKQANFAIKYLNQRRVQKDLLTAVNPLHP